MIQPRPVVRINRPAGTVASRADARPRQAAPAGRRRRIGLRVGLLGGSFNPAHGGHLAISQEALKRLRLDRVVWLVSPQNPLKPVEGMAGFGERIASARAIARHPRLLVSDLEQRRGLRFTVDTLSALQRDRRTRYVWLIGADNLVQLPRWRGWRQIVQRVPIAVFDREPYSYRGLAGKVAVGFGASRWPERAVGTFADAEPPAWVYVRFRRQPVSSTALRRRAEEKEEARF